MGEEVRIYFFITLNEQASDFSNGKCVNCVAKLQALNDIEGKAELPNNWNANPTKYALRYVFDGFVYVFIATVPHGSQRMHFELQVTD